MPPTFPTSPPTRLLISVQDAAEVDACLTGGADIVDIKTPARGPLGRPDAALVRAVVARVAGARPVTVAAGDLGELPPAELATWAAAAGATFLKIGLPAADAAATLERLAAARAALPAEVALAPALYADRLSAPPQPERLAALRRAADASWLVVDTADKQGPPLTDLWSRPQLARLLPDASDAGLRVALAGRLGVEQLASLGGLPADVIGVRGAVCVGGRAGRIDATLVPPIAELVARLATASKVACEKT